MEWLKEQVSRRFQQKEYEYLSTPVWLEPNRYFVKRGTLLTSGLLRGISM
jgi:hypothetical protein